MADKKQSDEQTNSATVIDFNRINLTLSFEGLPMMEVAVRRQLPSELEDARQAHLGLKQDEQEKQKQAFQAEHLGSILLEAPKNIPNYPLATPAEESYQDTFKKFFKQPENKELIGWLYTVYKAKYYPKEVWS